jgi:hypothetical protein
VWPCQKYSNRTRKSTLWAVQCVICPVDHYVEIGRNLNEAFDKVEHHHRVVHIEGSSILTGTEIIIRLN